MGCVFCNYYKWIPEGKDCLEVGVVEYRGHMSLMW